MRTLALVLAVVAVAGFAFAGDPPAEEGNKPIALGNAKCPVTGEEVDPNVTSEWDGMQARFCCPGCIDKFKADPAAFTKELLTDLAEQLSAARKQIKELEAKCAGAAPATPAAPAAPAAPRAPESVKPPAPADTAEIDLENATCPVMGKPARATIVGVWHGMKVRYCCKGCDGKFQADPAKYLALLKQDPAVAKRIEDAEARWAAAHPR